MQEINLNTKKHKQACIFCGSTKKLTKEHILPNWLCDLYPKDMMIINQFVGKVNKTWNSKIFQHTVKIVCEDCNGGWMSDLEMQARPILTKLMELNRFTLTKSDQEILSFWVQKTLLMLNQGVPGDLKITSDLYNDLYTRKKASSKVLVNLGWRMGSAGTKDQPISAFELKQVTSVSVSSKISSQVIAEKESGGFIWKAVFALGPVVFEMVGHNMQITLEVNAHSKVLVAIRPYSKDISWPTEWPIESEGGLAQIMRRI